MDLEALTILWMWRVYVASVIHLFKSWNQGSTASYHAHFLYASSSRRVFALLDRCNLKFTSPSSTLSLDFIRIRLVLGLELE
jgi:hypothetical protein